VSIFDAASDRPAPEKSIWIVRIALNRPYTFVVAALAIMLMKPIVLQRTPISDRHQVESARAGVGVGCLQ
jgi:hypothetical protein